MFRFKQFVIEDDCCSMKVGTDGVLLGAWVDVDLCSKSTVRVLDIGVGSGLIALMIAQRFEDAKVVGVEIDRASAEQAARNIYASSFSSRVSVECVDIQHYRPDELFDVIVCNPPFFEETLVSPNERRAQARHTSQGLGFAELIDVSDKLLITSGSLQVVIPTTSQQTFIALADRRGFALKRRMVVKTVARKAPKRVLLHFVKGRVDCPVVEESIVLMVGGNRSTDYSELCKDFYL